jgi:hypothetical protein
MLKKIFISDDKQRSQLHSTLEIMESLDEESRSIVDLETDSNKISELFKLNTQRDKVVEVNIDLSKYHFIFWHDNIEVNRYLLLEQLPEDCNMVFFSGGRSKSLGYLTDADYVFPRTSMILHYEINRSIYFENLSNFLKWAMTTGTYNIRSIFDNDYNPIYDNKILLKTKILDFYNISLDAALDSEEFDLLLKLNGYDDPTCLTIKEKIGRTSKFDFTKYIEGLVT